MPKYGGLLFGPPYMLYTPRYISISLVENLLYVIRVLAFNAALYEISDVRRWIATSMELVRHVPMA